MIKIRVKCLKLLCCAAQALWTESDKESRLVKRLHGGMVVPESPRTCFSVVGCCLECRSCLLVCPPFSILVIRHQILLGCSDISQWRSAVRAVRVDIHGQARSHSPHAQTDDDIEIPRNKALTCLKY